jgi:predicted secreted hydrolase
VRALAALGAALALAASAAASLPHVHLPRDHYAHSTAGAEWWYVTADVRGSDGHRYSVFVTLFRRGGLVMPVSQVVNLDTGALVGHSEIIVPARVGAASVDVRTPVAALRYDPAANTWSFGAFGLRYGVTLKLTPEKPYALHGGGTGIVGVGSIESGYYSATRSRVDGTFIAAGRTIGFRGTAWFDHQWVERVSVLSLPKWDWFACQFADDTELMAYKILAGKSGTAGKGGTFVRSDGSAAAVTDPRLVAGSRALSAAGRRWPLDWTIEVPAQHISVKARALVPDQLVQGFLHPTFWEGVATATGTKTGICFVEETG